MTQPIISEGFSNTAESAVAILSVPGDGMLSRDDLATLASELERAESDQATRAVLLHGAKSEFCGGLDLREFEDVELLDDLADALCRCFIAFARLSKPLVISVNGLACGFGATMLCHADVVVASERTRIRMPFLDLGLLPEAGSTLLLSRRVGHLNAVRLLCLTEEIDAREAQRIGLVTSVTMSAEVDVYATSLARSLARRQTDLLRTTRDLLRSEEGNVEERIRLEVAICLERVRDPALRRRLSRVSALKRPRPALQEREAVHASAA